MALTWYCREANNDLIVPDYQDIITTPDYDNGSPSSDDWIWCKDNAYKNYELPSKIIGSPIESAAEGFWNEYPFQVYEGTSNISACHNSSSVDPTCREASSRKHGALEDPLDYQIDNSMEQIDDIYLTSFLDEELLHVEIPYRSMSFESLLPDMLMDPQSPLKDDSCMGSAWYLKKWGFPLSMDNHVEDGDNPVNGPHNARDATVLSPNPNKQGQQVKCLEATVLQELEDITTQFTFKARICFRDALYRLARTSKLHSSVDQNELVNSVIDETSGITAGDGSMSFGGPKFAESKTNALDRTVANLMFNQKNCDVLYSPPSRPAQPSNKTPAKVAPDDVVLNQSFPSEHPSGIPPSNIESMNNSQLSYGYSRVEVSTQNRFT